VAGIALAVLLVVRALLPVLAERALERALGDAVGLPARIANVDLGLLAGTVSIEGLALGPAAAETPPPGPPPQAASAAAEAPPQEEAPAEDAPPAAAPDQEPGEPSLLRWERLIVDLRWRGLAAGRIHLAAVALEGPAIHVATDERGRLLLPDGGTEDADAPAEEDAADGARDDTAAGPATEEGDAAEPVPEAEAPGTPAEEAGPAAEEAEDGAEPAQEEDEEAGWPLRVDRLVVSDASARVASPDADAPAVEVAFDGLEVGSLRRDGRAISLGDVALRGPRVRAHRGFLLERPAAPGTGAEPAADAALRATQTPGDTYRVREVSVESGELTVRTAAGDLDASVELTAREVDTSRGARFPVTLEVRVGEGTFRVDGEAAASPPGFAGTVAWKDLPLPPLVLAARPDLHRWLRSCRAGGELEIEALPGEGSDAPLVARVRGRATVDDLHFEDPGGEDLSVRWRRLELDVREIAVPLGGEGRPRVLLSRLQLADPHVQARLPVESLDALGGGDEEEAAPADAGDGGPPPELAVDALEVSDGRVLVVDRTVDPTVRTALRQLEVSASDVAPAGPEAAPVEVDGRTLGGAPFSLSGSLAEDGGQLRFELERLPLPPLNPYAVAAGYRVREGDASLDTAIRVDGDTWRLDNGLVLHDLRLSRVSEAARLDHVIGMPVDLAVALLKDLGGDISLAIPMSFDPDGMRVSLATVLRDALRGAIAGAVTSPLKVMGAAIDFGRGVAADDPLKLDPLRFRPGTAELAADMAEPVEALAFMLERHPALGVVLRGSADPEADRDGLALRILAERAAAGQDMPEADVEGAGFIDRLRLGSALGDHAGGEPLELEGDRRALLEAWKRTVEVPAERLDALARARAEAARRALLTGHDVDPARVRAAEAAERDGPVVRIDFEAVDVS